MDIIKQLEQEEIQRLGKKIPNFGPGDTVVVNVNVVEGERKRVQAYEGVVIAKRNRGLNSSFIVRKISSGEGVERTFQTYSPLIASVEVKRRGDVGRAKLYYLRQRSGKAARIKEKLEVRSDISPEVVQPPQQQTQEQPQTPKSNRRLRRGAERKAASPAAFFSSARRANARRLTPAAITPHKLLQMAETALT